MEAKRQAELAAAEALFKATIAQEEARRKKDQKGKPVSAPMEDEAAKQQRKRPAEVHGMKLKVEHPKEPVEATVPIEDLTGEEAEHYEDEVPDIAHGATKQYQITSGKNSGAIVAVMANAEEWKQLAATASDAEIRLEAQKIGYNPKPATSKEHIIEEYVRRVYKDAPKEPITIPEGTKRARKQPTRYGAE